MPDESDGNAPLSPKQVAHIFGVTSATVVAWADAGRIKSFRTPAGHRRFRREDVDTFIAQQEGAA